MKKGDLCYVRPEVFYYMLDQYYAGFTTLDVGDFLIILDSSGTYSVTAMSHRGRDSARHNQFCVVLCIIAIRTDMGKENSL